MQAGNGGTPGRVGRAKRSGAAAALDEGEDGQAVVASRSKAKGKGKGKARAASVSPSKTEDAGLVTPAKIEEGRTMLLSEKQSELAAVLDRHDDLIREKFHMETFLMMVEYDPQVAKKDDSKVFQDYKAKYDLLETAALPSMSPRKTRSAHAQAAATLSFAGAGPSTSAVAGPSNANALSASSPARPGSFLKSPVRRIVVRKPTPASTSGRNTPNLSGSSRKGKGKAPATVSDDEREPESISVGLARGRRKEKGKGRESASASASASVSVPPPTTRHLRKRPGAASPPPDRAVGGDALSAPPRKRRKIEADPVGADSSPTADPGSVSAPVGGRVLRGGRGAPVRSELKSRAKGKGKAESEAAVPESDEDETQDNHNSTGGKTTVTTGRVMPHRSAAHRPQVSAPPLPHRRVLPASALPNGAKSKSKANANATTATAPPSSHSNIKRVKLLVRRPPPKHLSHPSQRPPPALFGSSVGRYLGSWVDVGGEEFWVGGTMPPPSSTAPVVGVLLPTANANANPNSSVGALTTVTSIGGVSLGKSSADLAQRAHDEAVLWERVEAMKRAGQWFGSDLWDTFRAGDTTAAAASAVNGDASASAALPSGSNSNYALPPPLNAPPANAWAAVVRSVIAHGRRARSSHNANTGGGAGGVRRLKTRGAVVAAQVAAKVQGYWDGEAAKVEKGRLVEEKRLRGVAKSVVRLVVGEWKKAVFHIREQERLRVEAEELKRGHEHLDAILDQSGHILDVQQGDLTRGEGGRSRSSSVSTGIMRWGEEEEEEEEEDEGEEEQGEGQEEEEVDAAEAEVEGDGEDVVVKPPEEEEEGDGDEGDDSVSRTTKSEAGDEEEEEDPSTSALGLLGDYPETPGSTTSALPEAGPSTPASESLADQQSVRGDEDEDDGDDASAVEDMMFAQVFDSPVRPRRAREDVAEDEDKLLPEDEDVVVASPAEDQNRDLSQPPSTRAETPAEESTAALVGDTEVVPAPPSPAVGPAPNPVDTLDSKPDETVDPKPDETLDSKADETLDSKPDETTEPAPQEQEEDSDESEDDRPSTPEIPAYLLPYAVAPVEWDASKRVTPPLLLRGSLRPYQQSGLEWLASLHHNNLNGILADEMGLGKTIQTIALLAHLACDRGIWGPHLIIVPTSVLLNWEMEFKKFLPGFKVLSYHGSTKRRKELRQGWNERHHFNVCITSYTLASRDAVAFKRKPWYYMILDEAHMIKNFKSQRWNTLLMFRSFRRLLLTGTPLQNNLTELWALLQFLMSGSNFVNLKEFGEWFSNPLEKAIEAGSVLDEDTMQRVTKLHTVLRPYLLRRLKRDVEKELPSKYEHLVLCPLSKRQRFLYDEFMSRAHTRDALQSGVYQKIANILMQLRKVCNHPDLFEVRPIVTSFAMERSAVADFEIKELLVRRRLLNDDEETVNLDLFGFRFVDRQGGSLIAARETRRLDGTTRLPFISEIPGVPPPKDTRTIAGFRAYSAYQQRAATISRWAHIGYLNRLRCNSFPIYSSETLSIVQRFHHELLPLSAVDTRTSYMDSVYLVNAAVKSYATRAEEMAGVVDRFTFVTPSVVARDLLRIALAGQTALSLPIPPRFDAVLHRASVKLQIAFPDPSLLQYDCGKLQQLTDLLRDKKAGGHRILIFTQMTKILDILEIFLNFHGYLYLRLDGATRIEDRQYITERFNADPRVFCFIASSRSGGVGINLTGADTVVFYDSDFNPQMDRQCEDRAHRIGQIRDVHIYRFVSQHTVEEAMLRKANQKRSLDDLVIQKGEFDWRTLFGDDGSALTRALGEFEDREDAHAAAVAAREEVVLEGQDKAEFLDVEADGAGTGASAGQSAPAAADEAGAVVVAEAEPEPEEPEEEGGSVADYMIAFVQRDPEYFREWKL